jgi:hypothetical protein
MQKLPVGQVVRKRANTEHAMVIEGDPTYLSAV